MAVRTHETRTRETRPRLSPHRCVTSYDLKRLSALVHSRLLNRRGELAMLGRLKDGLDQATVVPPQDIAPQIVTMYSQVRVRDLTKRRTVVCTLVFPAEAATEQGRISVLSPVGSALLGRHAGDLVSCVAPSGPREMKIIDVVYQPEAMGDYLR